jgi:predicted HicB family RNase H-like nuclease
MKKKKINIGINADLHTKAKIICVLKGITLNDYVARALEKELEKDKSVLDKIK